MDVGQKFDKNKDKIAEAYESLTDTLHNEIEKFLKKTELTLEHDDQYEIVQFTLADIIRRVK